MMTRNVRATLIAEPGKKEAIIMRVFDAPRELVWEAYTTPDLIKQWWAPKRLKTIIDKMEVKEGGDWRLINPAPNGLQHGFSGRYLVVAPPERLVQTFNYELMPGHEVLESLTLEDQGGRTKVTATAIFFSVEDRDGMIKAGMEESTPETMDMLGDLLERMRKERRK
jgi:uncharacterized protein YndB with AHSA1/START domain